MRRARGVIDVAVLPDLRFGPRDIMWWGTLCFMVIEGFTLVLCAMVYIYLHQNFASWPPQNTSLPSLLIPTVQVAVMVASVPLMIWLDRRARDFDLGGVRIGLTAAAVIAALCAGLRVAELLVSGNVKWDANAYGSAFWLVVGAHGTLLFVELVELAGMALMFWIAPIERKHFGDASDVAFYWYFIVGSWIPLYAICFLLPYWS